MSKIGKSVLRTAKNAKTVAVEILPDKTFVLAVKGTVKDARELQKLADDIISQRQLKAKVVTVEILPDKTARMMAAGAVKDVKELSKLLRKTAKVTAKMVSSGASSIEKRL